MSGLVLFAFLAVGLVPTAIWCWLLAGIWKTGTRYALAVGFSQLSAYSFFVALFAGAGGWAFAYFFAPPLFFVRGTDALVQRATMFFDFLVLVIPWSLSATAFLLSVIAFLWRPWVWLPGLFCVLLSSTSLAVGEFKSWSVMCETADAQGHASIRRNSLLWSLFHVPQELQFEVHATAGSADDLYAWSYRDMNWYPVPANVYANANSAPINCS
jgi:hypothetical protein